jgi:hypothetical protein
MGTSGELAGGISGACLSCAKGCIVNATCRRALRVPLAAKARLCASIAVRTSKSLRPCLALRPGLCLVLCMTFTETSSSSSGWGITRASSAISVALAFAFASVSQHSGRERQ